jgi:PhnB protein
MKVDKTKKLQTKIVPTLFVSNAAAALVYYKMVFEAEVIFSNEDATGSLVAELDIDGARFVIADESPAHNNFSPEKYAGTPIRIGLMIADPDALMKRAVAAGATEVYPVADQTYGYRLGHFIDPFGHHWEPFCLIQ